MLFFELVYNGIKDAVDKLAAARRRIAVGYFDIFVERYRNRNLREIDYFCYSGEHDDNVHQCQPFRIP